MPRFGLISDTHGRHAAAHTGAALLAHAGVDTILHLGDIGDIYPAGLDASTEPSPGPRVLRAIVDAVRDVGRSPIPLRLVYGNNDSPSGLRPTAESLGYTIDHPAGWIELPDNRVLVYQHGDDDAAMREAILSDVAYLCHGHSHVVTDRRERKSRIINPGALYRASRLTVAVLDTDRDKLELIEVR